MGRGSCRPASRRRPRARTPTAEYASGMAGSIVGIHYRNSCSSAHPRHSTMPKLAFIPDFRMMPMHLQVTPRTCGADRATPSGCRLLAARHPNAVPIVAPAQDQSPQTFYCCCWASCKPTVTQLNMITWCASNGARTMTICCFGCMHAHSTGANTDSCDDVTRSQPTMLWQGAAGA